MIRAATASDFGQILAVINDSAEAYRGVISPALWHEPYMSSAQLQAETGAGIRFSCFTRDGAILGVMGIQDKGAVVLIRHAYVRTAARRRGIGAELLNRLVAESDKPILIGTWKAATWALDFYGKHGFRVLPDSRARTLLETFWNVPARQMDTSVVLADERFLSRDTCSVTA